MATAGDDLYSLAGEIQRTVDGFTTKLATERVTAEAGEGTVRAVMGLDGFLERVDIGPRGLRDHGLAGLSQLVRAAVRDAEDRAQVRRDELAGQVQFLGYPVLELVEEMANDPEAAIRRLSGDD
jgi:DNA-binding protein YbaB